MSLLQFFKYFRFLHYFDNNQNLFLYSTIFFCLLIIFVFIIYIYLLILSYNGKKIENKKIVLMILRYIMNFLCTIFIIPLQGKYYI